MSFFAKSHSLGMAALIFAASSLLSRCMGLVRDKVISWQFGASNEADMYFAAFVVPDIINYLLAGGFMAITLLPLLAQRFAADEEDAWRFFSTVFSWMALAATLFTVVAMAFALPLAKIVAPGLDPLYYQRLAFFMRINMPAQIFFLTGSCLTALLYLRKQFAIPALSPLIYNGCIILCGVLLPEIGLVQGMTGYCIGVVLGACLGTFLLPLYVLAQRGLHLRLSLQHPCLKTFLVLALPLMIGQTITALDEQFLRIFGSLTGDGSVSLLNYAKRVSQVPVALVGQAAALASYPFLVDLLTKGQRDEFQQVLAKSLRSGLTLITALAIWMAFLAPSTFTLLFYGGRMSDLEIIKAVPLLQLMLLATPLWVLVEILVRGFYAQKDTLTPSVAGTIITVLMLPLYYFVAVPLGATGVAFASGFGLLLYTLVLGFLWIRRDGKAIFTGLGTTMCKAALCALPGSIGGYLLDRQVALLLPNTSPLLVSFIGLMLAGLFFLATFVPLGTRFCPEVMQAAVTRIRQRCSKKK